jgi:hypothetical protein
MKARIYYPVSPNTFRKLYQSRDMKRSSILKLIPVELGEDFSYSTFTFSCSASAWISHHGQINKNRTNAENKGKQ